MKRFLLLALTAGLLSPIAAKAESYWLIITGSSSFEKVQMGSMEQCEDEMTKLSERNTTITQIQKEILKFLR